MVNPSALMALGLKRQCADHWINVNEWTPEHTKILQKSAHKLKDLIPAKYKQGVQKLEILRETQIFTRPSIDVLNDLPQDECKLLLHYLRAIHKSGADTS